MVAYINQQIQSEQHDYLQRVTKQNGRVRPDVQIALNRFIKKMYTNNLRDPNRESHKLMHLQLFCTEDFRGCNELLFYTDSPSATPEDGTKYSYTVDKGLFIAGAPQAANVYDTGFAIADNLQAASCSIGYWLTKDCISRGEFGNNEENFPNDARLLSHPDYNANSTIYFDAGNNAQTRRVSGRIPTAANGDNTNFGLTVCSKAGNEGYISHDNTLVAENNNLALNDPLPDLNFLINPGFDYTEYYFVGGYFVGLHIPLVDVPMLYEEWGLIQDTISVMRNNATKKVPREQLWYNARHTDKLVRSGNNVTAWRDSSPSNLQIDTSYANGFSTLYVPSEEGLDFRKISMQRSNGFYFGAVVFVVTTSKDITYQGAYDTERRRYYFKSLLSTRNNFRTGIILGDGFSTLADELIAYGDNRQFRGVAGLTGRDRVILNSTKFVLIVSRLDNGKLLMKYNNLTVPLTYASDTVSIPSYTNQPFRVGVENRTDYTLTSWEGLFHEIRNYRESLDELQCTELAFELMASWRIEPIDELP